MPTMKHHERVEQLRAARERELAQLTYTTADGRQAPAFAPDLQAQKVKAIEEKFEAALVALMEEAQATHDAAAAILARVDRPYDWLTADELARASTLAPFVREDLATLDPAALLQAMEHSMGGEKATRWLTYRYAAQRYAQLDSSPETAPGMVARHAYSQLLPAMRDSLMPPALLKERQKAQAQDDDAKTLYECAEWARPSVRQAFAARVGVKAEHLPE